MHKCVQLVNKFARSCKVHYLKANLYFSIKLKALCTRLPSVSHRSALCIATRLSFEKDKSAPNVHSRHMYHLRCVHKFRQ
jgi:hypothetical protein